MARVRNRVRSFTSAGLLVFNADDHAVGAAGRHQHLLMKRRRRECHRRNPAGMANSRIAYRGMSDRIPQPHPSIIATAGQEPMSSSLCLKPMSFFQNPPETTPTVRPKFWANVQAPSRNSRHVTAGTKQVLAESSHRPLTGFFGQHCPDFVSRFSLK
jgi:hypothetical protein